MPTYLGEPEFLKIIREEFEETKGLDDNTLMSIIRDERPEWLQELGPDYYASQYGSEAKQQEDLNELHLTGESPGILGRIGDYVKESGASIGQGLANVGEGLATSMNPSLMMAKGKGPIEALGQVAEGVGQVFQPIDAPLGDLARVQRGKKLATEWMQTKEIADQFGLDPSIAGAPPNPIEYADPLDIHARSSSGNEFDDIVSDLLVGIIPIERAATVINTMRKAAKGAASAEKAAEVLRKMLGESEVVQLNLKLSQTKQLPTGKVPDALPAGNPPVFPTQPELDPLVRMTKTQPVPEGTPLTPELLELRRMEQARMFPEAPMETLAPRGAAEHGEIPVVGTMRGSNELLMEPSFRLRQQDNIAQKTQGALTDVPRHTLGKAPAAKQVGGPDPLRRAGEVGLRRAEQKKMFGTLTPSRMFDELGHELVDTTDEALAGIAKVDPIGDPITNHISPVNDIYQGQLSQVDEVTANLAFLDEASLTPKHKPAPIPMEQIPVTPEVKNVARKTMQTIQEHQIPPEDAMKAAQDMFGEGFQNPMTESQHRAFADWARLWNSTDNPVQGGLGFQNMNQFQKNKRLFNPADSFLDEAPQFRRPGIMNGGLRGSFVDFRSSDNVIRDQGMAGNAFMDSVRTVENVSERRGGTAIRMAVNALDEMHQAMGNTTRFINRGRKAKAREVAEGNVRDALDGLMGPSDLNVHEAAAFNTIRKLFDTVAKRAGQLGTMERTAHGKQLFQYRENYFPHNLDVDKIFKNEDKAIRNVVERLMAEGAPKESAIRIAKIKLHNYMNYHAGTPRMSNLEFAREFDLPPEFYNRNLREVIQNYMARGHRRLAEIETWGQNDEIAAQMLKAIDNEGGNALYADRLFKRLRGIDGRNRGIREASKLARAANVPLLMMAQTINLSQSALTALRTTNRATFRALLDYGVLNRKATSDFAHDAGVTLDAMAGELSRHVGGVTGSSDFILKWTGFNATERFNRIVAAGAGKHYAQRLGRNLIKGGRKGKQAERELTRLGLDHQMVRAQGGELTQKQLLRAAQQIVNDTQFRVRASDLPLWWTSAEGKMITQFKNFIFNQTKLVKNELFGSGGARSENLVNVVSNGIDEGFVMSGFRSGSKKFDTLLQKSIGSKTYDEAYDTLKRTMDSEGVGVGGLNASPLSKRMANAAKFFTILPASGFIFNTARREFRKGGAEAMGFDDLEWTPSPVVQAFVDTANVYGKFGWNRDQRQFAARVVDDSLSVGAMGIFWDVAESAFWGKEKFGEFLLGPSTEAAYMVSEWIGSGVGALVPENRKLGEPRAKAKPILPITTKWLSGRTPFAPFIRPKKKKHKLGS
jgi:hypothetical protein